MRGSVCLNVIVITSGPTEWESTHRLQGNTDLPLSADGLTFVEQQAIAHPVAPQLGIKWVYCSTDEASRQTAMVFAATAEARIKPLEDLAEMHLGLWQGLIEDTISDRYAKSYEVWRETPDAVAIPDGETWEQAAERMQRTVGKLVTKADPDQPLVLVLRPILGGMCRRWLSGQPVTDWREPTRQELVTEIKVNPAELAIPGRRRRRIVA